MAAWEADRDTFGLPFAADRHPDSHKVLYMLCGKKGLVAQGMLNRRVDGLLFLTEDGRAVCKAAREGGEDPRPPRVPHKASGVAPAVALAGQGVPTVTGPAADALDSEALKTFTRDDKDTITFRQALDFWGLTRAGEKDVVAGAIKGRMVTDGLAAFDQSMTTLEDHVCTVAGTTTDEQRWARLESGRLLTPADPDVLNLRLCSAYLRRKFGKILATLEARP
jgi:hypothetical protein